MAPQRDTFGRVTQNFRGTRNFTGDDGTVNQMVADLENLG